MPDLLSDVWAEMAEKITAANAAKVEAVPDLPKVSVEDTKREESITIENLDVPALCREHYELTERAEFIKNHLEEYMVSNKLKQYKEKGFTVSMIPEKESPRLIKEKIPKEILEAATEMRKSKPYVSITRSKNTKGKTLVRIED